MFALLKRYVWRPLALTLSEVTWFGFLFSAVLVAGMVNLATNILSTVTSVWWSLGLLVFLLAATIVFANWQSQRIRRRISLGPRVIGGKAAPRQRPGLIVMASGGKTGRQAVRHHTGSLAHVWIIETPEMAEPSQQLRRFIEDQGVQWHILPVDDEFDAAQCYRRVRDVFLIEGPAVGLAPSDIIADLTGGTKLMTAGMVLACGDLNQALQFVPTEYVAGEPTEAFQPIEVALARSGRAG